MALTITFKVEAYGGIKFRRTMEWRSELIEGQSVDTREALSEMTEAIRSVENFIANDLSALDEAEHDR